MSGASATTVDELDPTDAYNALSATDNAALIDVRTRAEWTFTGVPDMHAAGVPFCAIEWARFPDMAPNPAFMEQLMEQCGGALPGRMFFICRSGARSMAAAQMVAQTAGHPVHCTNVAEGFEGDLDANGHRGTVNGWKARGLPWRQS